MYKKPWPKMRVHHVRYSSIPLWSLLLHRFLVIVSHVDVVGRRSPRLYCIIANNKFISLCNGRIHFTFQDRFSPSGKRKCFWPLHWGRHGLTCMVRPKAKPHCAKTTEEPPVCCLLALAYRLRHRFFFVWVYSVRFAIGSTLCAILATYSMIEWSKWSR